MTTQTALRGIHGEDIVAHHLEKQGFTIVERNYRQRYGEIDIIAQKTDLIVFVEVKARAYNRHFDHTQSITSSKQRKIALVAQRYLAQYHHDDKTCRFDVAIVEYKDTTPTIVYLDNAFQWEG